MVPMQMRRKQAQVQISQIYNFLIYLLNMIIVTQ